MECVFEMAWMKLFKNVILVANKLFLIMHNSMKTWKLKKNGNKCDRYISTNMN